MTMNGVPSRRVSTSITRAMLASSSLDAARASRRKRSTASLRSTSSGRRNLIATRCSRWMWKAATTVAMPPWPMTRSSRYLFRRMSPSCSVPNMRADRGASMGGAVKDGALPLRG